MPPPPTPQYLTILMTERGGAIIFCRILARPNAPPPPDATMLNYLNDRERGRHYLFLLWDYGAPQCPPPPDATILNYILLTERWGAPLSFVGFWRSPMPPPPPTPQYLTILVTDRGGAIIFCGILAPPNASPPPTPQYLTILITERGGAIIFVRFWRHPPPRRHKKINGNDSDIFVVIVRQYCSA